MYAIIETGGKQYRVEKGDIIDVEKLSFPEDKKEEGEKRDRMVQFDRVLFLNEGSRTLVGDPYIGHSFVKGEVLQEVKGSKVISFKYKQRKGIRRKVGHRQNYSRVKIHEIVTP